MAARLLVFVAIQGVIFQDVFGQCLNRVLPGFAPGFGPVVDGILPNQLLIREAGLPVVPAPPAYPIPSPIIPEIGYTPTIIQDSSVANSLANALQLLVVSNLLSTTLPGPCDVPYPVDVLGVPGYNYIY